jgi:hypothetical protein
MNLIQVQDRLNKLPPLPQSIQYLTAAAQGGNPEVPPFMALARINEINKEMQSAQTQKPPAEPLNQSLPKQAMQNMGIGALPQAAPQGMPQGAQPAPQMQAPAGMPPQQAPQMPPQQPPQGMAEGGLAGLPVDPRMFQYGSGGVVAFNGEDGDQEVSEDADYDAGASMRELAPYIKAALKQQAPSITAPSDIEARLREKNDYGIEEGPIGKGYLEGLASLKEAKAAERAKQQQDLELRRKLSSSKGLLDWAEASRGRTGMGGVGALGRNYINSVDKFTGEEAALREDAIKQDALLNEAQYKMQELRTAKLKGDVAGEYKAQADMAKIAKDLNVSQNQLMARLAGGNLGLLGREAAAGAAVDAATIRANRPGGAGAKPTRETDLVLNQKAQAALLRKQHPEWSEEEVQAEAFKIAKTMATEPGTAVRENTEMQKAWQKEKYTGDYVDAPDKEAYRRKWEADYMRKNPQSAAAPAPTAGKSVLPPGTTTGKVVPGKGTEVLKDGKLIGYAN